MAETRKALIERLFSEHGGALQAFFRRRIRAKPEATDLTQEVYLRMLRVSEAEIIRNPEAYLYTVASNLIKEHAVLERRQSRTADLMDPTVAPELAEMPAFESDVDTEQRIRRLREVFGQLSPKCQAVIVMQYRHGMSYAEIAGHLGVSTNMVKKHLVRALTHCRKRMGRME